MREFNCLRTNFARTITRLHASLGKPAAGGKAPEAFLEAVFCLPNELQFETRFIQPVGQKWQQSKGSIS